MSRENSSSFFPQGAAAHLTVVMAVVKAVCLYVVQTVFLDARASPLSTPLFLTPIECVTYLLVGWSVGLLVDWLVGLPLFL